MVTNFNKMCSGYWPHQVVKWLVNRSFEYHLCSRHKGTDNVDRDGLKMVIYLPFNHLMWLLAQENIIEFCYDFKN